MSTKSLENSRYFENLTWGLGWLWGGTAPCLDGLRGPWGWLRGPRRLGRRCASVFHGVSVPCSLLQSQILTNVQCYSKTRGDVAQN